MLYLRNMSGRVLNVAGNGIYTLSKKGVTQKAANQYVYDIVSLVHKHWPLEKIVSGGQTGLDFAGLVTGCSLDIETIGMWPNGFKMRIVEGKDINMTEDKIRNLVYGYVGELEL